MNAKTMNSHRLCVLPEYSTPNCATPAITSTMVRVCRRPILSDSQPTSARPVPLTADSTPAADAATNGPNPLALANGTWKLMPNSDTPPMITRQPHINGSMPVRNASFGVNCRTAGGFLDNVADLPSLPFPPLLKVSGSTSAGHQFFGGSLNRNPQNPTTTNM